MATPGRPSKSDTNPDETSVRPIALSRSQRQFTINIDHRQAQPDRLHTGSTIVALEPETVSSVLILLMIFGAWCVAIILFDLGANCLFASAKWPWMLQSFECHLELDSKSTTWEKCDFAWKSTYGETANTGGNMRATEVCVTAKGLGMRVPLYAPSVFTLWRWWFAAKLFPPVLIPWDKVIGLTPHGCLVQSTDKHWPTMEILTAQEIRNEIACHLEHRVGQAVPDDAH
jgi:hypothetical protein